MRWLAAAILVLALPTPSSPQTQPSQLGDFVHHQRASEDGDDRSLVATRSEDGLLVLAWQCTKTGMRVFTALGWRWIGNVDDDIIVAYWFPGDTRPTETLWRLGETGTVAWMRIGDTALFTETAESASTVRLTLNDPYDGESREAAFPLGQLSDALDVLGCQRRRLSKPGG